MVTIILFTSLLLVIIFGFQKCKFFLFRHLDEHIKIKNDIMKRSKKKMSNAKELLKKNYIELNKTFTQAIITTNNFIKKKELDIERCINKEKQDLDNKLFYVYYQHINNKKILIKKVILTNVVNNIEIFILRSQFLLQSYQKSCLNNLKKSTCHK